MASQTSPLLNTSTAKTTTSPTPPTPFAKTALTILGTTRVIFGTACLIAPVWTLGLLGIPIAPAAALFPRAFGVRDIVMGELLLSADTSSDKEDGNNNNNPAAAGDRGRREVRRLLYGGMAADVVDIVVVGLALEAGHVGWAGFGSVVGAAVISIVLAVESLIGYTK